MPRHVRLVSRPISAASWGAGLATLRRRSRIGAVASCLLVTASLLAAGAAGARSARFHAHVDGVETGPGHRFVVGDGLNLVFVDTYRSHTAYRVCWSRGAGRRCWDRSTATRGHASRIFTAAPQNVGTYVVTWSVSGRAVARWSFYNDVGD